MWRITFDIFGLVVCLAILVWAYRRKDEPAVEQIVDHPDFGTNHCGPVNFGRELAKLRNPNKRAEYKAFHDELRAKLGLEPFEWSK